MVRCKRAVNQRQIAEGREPALQRLDGEHDARPGVFFWSWPIARPGTKMTALCQWIKGGLSYDACCCPDAAAEVSPVPYHP